MTPGVAPEQLVRAIAREGHRDVPPGLASQVVERRGRGDAERLVEMPGDARQIAHEVRAQIDLVMPGAELCGGKWRVPISKMPVAWLLDAGVIVPQLMELPAKQGQLDRC